MSKTEVMLVMILFRDQGYRCLKHFYLEKVCKYLRHLFLEVVSYNHERCAGVSLRQSANQKEGHH